MILIVVLDVFLDIQGNNLNEAAADRRANSAYLSQLQGDLQDIEAQVSEQLKFEQFRHGSLSLWATGLPLIGRRNGI